MTEPITIGVDHGYAAMKTAHCSFPSGLAEYEHEPYTQKNVLCYDGKYYVVGSGRQPLQKDKTADENYYLLTLAAIAKEIAYRNAPTTTPVILAAGLPLTSFGREKKAFRAYLLREGKPVSFSYEGISYETSVQDVKLFPQGYAAILQHSDLLNEPSVILADIGGWTVDIMRLDNRIPNAASCRSLELGMIRCLDEIAEQVRRSLNLSLTSAQIENVLRGSPDSMDDRVKAIIQREAGLYDEGKSWNKNMIARILENPKYTGADNYPKLVDIKLFEAAAEKRQTKQRLPERTPAQKALKRVCSKPPTPEIEQQVTHLLGKLAEQPERIMQPEQTSKPTHTNTQAELDDILNTQPLDEDAARSLICKLAQEQYDAIGNEEYETERLRRLFTAFECTAELNAELLQSTVSAVLVAHQTVRLQLKNGQIIGKDDLA